MKKTLDMIILFINLLFLAANIAVLIFYYQSTDKLGFLQTFDLPFMLWCFIIINFLCVVRFSILLLEMK